VKLKHFNIDEFTQDLPEITADKIDENCKLTPAGLFSQQIFGPLRSYKCGCSRSIYRGPHGDEDVCKVCNVEITSSEERAKRYAKIALPFPILNPLIYMIILKAKPGIKKVLYNMLFYKVEYIFNDEAELVEFDPNVDDPAKKLVGVEGTKSYILYLCKDSEKPELKFITDNEDIMICNNVIVMPPAFRNINKNNNGSYTTDALNRNYRELLMRTSRIRDMNFEIKENSDIHIIYFRAIQTHAIEIYEYIMDKLSKKNGLIRGNILGKRVDFSGRAVISPDPTLHLDECRIPYLILLEMFKPKLITYLVNRKVVNRHNKASELIDKCIVENDTQLMTYLEDFVKNRVCILNRQPTLHRMSVLAFHIKINPGNTIMIHPLICGAYNADFDGDQMAIYIAVTDRCAKDINEKIGIWNNLLSPADGEIVPKPNQDIILGIYTATKNNTNKRYEYKNVVMSKERLLFNQCLPEDYHVINETVDNKLLKTILNDIVLKYSPLVSMKVLDAVKELGFRLSTKYGYTLSIDDLHDPEFDAFSDSLTGDIQKDMLKISTNKKIHAKIKKKPYYIFTESGARGSMDQLLQLTVARGYVADVTNKLRPDLIRASLVRGMKQKDYFNSAWGTRKGLLDTALSTSSSGYITRQLIYSTVNMELGDVDDCKTTEYMNLEVIVRDKTGRIDDSKSEALARTLIWRYIVGKDGSLFLITRDNYKALIGRKIQLRSPIYCKSKHICKKCYGNVSNILHSTQIGIVATQCIGERITQLVLRSFHTSGVAQGSGENNQNQDIISGMSLVNKLFHKPTDLKEVNEPIDLVLALNSIFSQYGNIMLVHYETIASAMMWSDKKMWRTIPNRNNFPYKFESILKIPSISSWLLGISFARLKNRLLDGVTSSSADTPSAISKLFRL
jgi:DNA-directed RNA polymerase subunit beta'